MNNPSLDMERLKALDQQLAESVVQCKRHNILVHVESINSKQSVAFCSVAQRRRGLFWRERPSHYLAWQAEMALAPLRRHGITPLIAVQDKRLARNGPSADKKPLHDPADPFGWRYALSLSGGPMLKGTGTGVTPRPIGRIRKAPDAYRVEHGTAAT